MGRGRLEVLVDNAIRVENPRQTRRARGAAWRGVLQHVYRSVLVVRSSLTLLPYVRNNAIWPMAMLFLWRC